MLLRVLSELGRLSLYFISFILGFVLLWFATNKLLYTALDPDSKDTKLVQVNQGDSFEAITQRLVEEKILKHAFSSNTLASFRSPEEQEKLKKIPAGEYKLSPSMTPEEILEEFVSENVVYYEYSIPAGSSLKDIAKIIGKTGLVSEEDMAALLYSSRRRAQGLILDLGLAVKSLEGYIFPETYKFSRPISAKDIVKRMYQEGNKKISDEFRKRAAELTFTFHDIRTLASIIEKETEITQERARISSVFHNRLRIGMPLQSDPTVIYGIPDFTGELTKVHLRTNSPYNTYLNTGLPPTPICNPGIETIKAALYPEDTEYVYFVAKNDDSGEHFFSSTYKEHQKAIQVFQHGKSPTLLMKELNTVKSSTVSAPDPKKPKTGTAKVTISKKNSSTNANKNVKPKKRARKQRWRPFSQLDPVRAKDAGTPEVVDPAEMLKKIKKYR